MKNKNILTRLIAVMAVLCTLSMCGCGSKTISDSELYNTGVEMTTLMGDMVKNPAYTDLVLSRYANGLDSFIAYDYDSPTRAYIIDVPSNETLLQLRMSEDEESADKLEALPSALREQLLKRVSFELVIVNIIADTASWDEMDVAMSIYAQRDLKGTLKKNVAILYIFETGKPIIVYYRQQAKDSVTAQSFFLGKNIFTTLSDTREVFSKYGCSVTSYN